MNLEPETLRDHRRAIGATLTDLAERSRLSVRMLSAYELGEWNIGPPARERVRAALVDLARERGTAASTVLKRFGRSRRRRS